jgi:hypothetical protein
MFSFLRRLFPDKSDRGSTAPSVTTATENVSARTPRTLETPNLASDDEYFSTMSKMRAAISARDYENACVLARQNLRQIPAFVRRTKRQYGSFDIPSIPTLEQGGTILALMGDQGGLEEMKRIVETVPELKARKEAIANHFENLRLFQQVTELVVSHPGCLQTSLRDLTGASNGRRIATVIVWLEKAGRIRRTKQGSTYSLTIVDRREPHAGEARVVNKQGV